MSRIRLNAAVAVFVTLLLVVIAAAVWLNQTHAVANMQQLRASQPGSTFLLPTVYTAGVAAYKLDTAYVAPRHRARRHRYASRRTTTTRQRYVVKKRSRTHSAEII